MKKYITKILSLVLTVILSVGFLSGCDLITTDVEVDMNQTVATIQLEGMNKEEIKKRELVSSFNSNGYIYMYYYGYTQQETIEKLIGDLVNNRIIVQQSKQALTTKTTALKNEKGFFALAKEEQNPTSKDKVLLIKNWKGQDMVEVGKNDPVDSFLTEYEVLKAKYTTLKTVKNLLDGYSEEEEEHDHSHEELTFTPRATLTKETAKTANEWEMQNDEELKLITEEFKNQFKKDIDELNIVITDGMTKFELSKTVYSKYIEKFDLTSNEVKKSLKKLIKDLKTSGFISSEEASRSTPSTVEEVLNLTYFQDTYRTTCEGLLIDKLELALENNEEKKFSDENALCQEYITLYNSQKALYTNNHEAYETALENANDSTFVVYNPNFGEKYGYVKNLLIGVNAEQDALLKAYKEEIVGDKAKFREELFKGLKAKDLRDTWVLSNYGSYEEGKFTFGGDYCKTDALKEFQGTISGAKEYKEHDTNNVEVSKYTFNSVEAKEITFNELYNKVSEIMGFTGLQGKLENVEDSTIVSKVIKEEVLDKFNDLIYAYSTDPGSLNENLGYIYSPITSMSKYAIEYAEASKRLVEKGVGSYEVVATDFGYHIMLCTSIIEPSNVDATPETLKTEFENTVNVKGSLANMFKEYKYNLISSTTITNIVNTLINSCNKNESIVKYYTNRYEDLLAQ